MDTFSRASSSQNDLADDDLVQSFEDATVDPARFHHREHLYVAFRYLSVLEPEEALARFVRHLRRLAAALGTPEKFHATMTWAYLVLLHEAMVANAGASFEDLLARNPALLDSRSGVLHEHYTVQELEQADARRRFILPRRR